MMKKLKTWYLLFLAGVILISIGIFSWLTPLNSYIKLVKYSGFVLLLHGILLIMASVAHKVSIKEKNWMLVESIVDLFFGVLLAVSPILSFFVFPILIGHWILCLGILKIGASLSLRRNIRGWVFISFTGALAIVFGILIAYVPFTKANDINLLIGSFGVTMGFLAVFDSFRFRKMEGALNMML